MARLSSAKLIYIHQGLGRLETVPSSLEKMLSDFLN